MRIGLVSIATSISPPPAEGNDGDLPARDRRVSLLSLAGRTLVERQISVAGRLGCESIVCITQGLPDGHIVAQEAAEAIGARFHLIESARELAGLIRAADEVFAFAEGVLVPAGVVEDAFDARGGVLTMAADVGVPNGFERIDADRAWAGVLRCPGSNLERVAQLAPDIDIVATLLRIALQGGARTVPVEPELIETGALARFETTEHVAAAQRRWLDARLGSAPWTAPGQAIADRIARLAADRFYAAGWSVQPPIVGGAVSVALAALAAVPFGPAVGFGALTLAMLLLAIITRIAQAREADVVAATVSSPGAGRGAARWLPLYCDLAIGSVPLMAFLPEVPVDLLFALGVLVASTRIAGRSLTGGAAALAVDRVLLCLALAAAAGFGHLVATAQALAALVLLATLLAGRAAHR